MTTAGTFTPVAEEESVAAEESLVGLRDIADLLGVTRQAVDKWSRDDPTFPKPTAVLNRGRLRVWRKAEVDTWIRNVYRRRRRRPTSPPHNSL
jgi:predicted DNA-binding transcriptional regulator AlpA